MEDYQEVLEFSSNVLAEPAIQAYKNLEPAVLVVDLQQQTAIVSYRQTKRESADSIVPFLAFHYLDEEEEIKLFDVINSKAKGIGTSLSRYLNRDNDEISWVATNLILKPGSPFFSKGTLIGRRTKEKNVTLQNLYNIIKLLTKKSALANLSKERKLNIALYYFNLIKELFPEHWDDNQLYRMTHITCLNTLAIVGNEIINENYSMKSQQPDSVKITKLLNNLKEIDWLSSGNLKYIKGAAGSKMLADDILNCLYN
ncbi:DGQHR domain-containing protein [Lysinibacillus sp. NPDC093688]|uniref:DGQHR domain-containing protein n=1 Tax=Lysinibacillus sp. NPDC093688 TaxID=3390577 RepID=UPI003D0733F2